VKVDPHKSTVAVPEGDFRIYREETAFMGAHPRGSLLGYFRLELSNRGHIFVPPDVTGQLASARSTKRASSWKRSATSPSSTALPRLEVISVVR